jgi:S-formylglutathione hydrolase FrmB
MHPTLFSAFVDIAGDLYPNAGNKAETISRLFGGSADAWASYDPTTVITRHGPYTGIAGWFAISAPGTAHHQPPITDTAAMRLAGRAAEANPSNQTAAANALCAVGRTYGIDCAVVPAPGKHDWPFADRAFAAALPWLAGQLGTPGAPRILLPGASNTPAAGGAAPAQVVAAGR